jgi:hypothetical protein
MTPQFWHRADSALDRQLCHELACCGDVTIPAGKSLAPFWRNRYGDVTIRHLWRVPAGSTVDSSNPLQ